MQADFVLFIRDSLDRLKRTEPWHVWWPVTLVYTERQNHAFELFARSQSKVYFARLFPLFDISGKEELDSLMKAFKEQKVRLPTWEFTVVDPAQLMGYQTLASRS